MSKEVFDLVMRYIAEGKDDDFIKGEVSLTNDELQEFRNGEIPSSIEVTF